MTVRYVKASLPLAGLRPTEDFITTAYIQPGPKPAPITPTPTSWIFFLTWTLSWTQ